MKTFVVIVSVLACASAGLLSSEPLLAPAHEGYSYEAPAAHAHEIAVQEHPSPAPIFAAPAPVYAAHEPQHQQVVKILTQQTQLAEHAPLQIIKYVHQAPAIHQAPQIIKVIQPIDLPAPQSPHIIKIIQAAPQYNSYNPSYGSVRIIKLIRDNASAYAPSFAPALPYRPGSGAHVKIIKIVRAPQQSWW